MREMTDEQVAEDRERRAGMARELRDAYRDLPFEVLREQFLDRIDAYLSELMHLPVDWQIASHEAGGAWRIAFSHRLVRPDPARDERMGQVMDARRAWARRAFFHGFPDEAEVHHEIETFTYFQCPLLHAALPGMAIAGESAADVAEHVINDVSGVPDWYDWTTHGFTSVYLGTRSVRARPPFDYQEANHWRFIAVALAVHQISGRAAYLDLAVDYARRWSSHIERCLNDDQPVRCSILPETINDVGEMGYGGNRAPDARGYRVFYSTVAANTAYDVFVGLTDTWRRTGERRFLEAARGMLDQFFDHPTDARPATHHRAGQWTARAYGDEWSLDTALLQEPAFLVRMATRHDALVDQPRYRAPILRWAHALDEATHACDFSACDVPAATSWYTGDNRWLARGLAMALRVLDLTDSDERADMCSKTNRYGGKFLLEGLYLPLAGVVDAGTRGGVPIRSGPSS